MITLHVAKANKSRRELLDLFYRILKCLSCPEYSTQGSVKGDRAIRLTN